jgi:hypothetical protein
MGNVIQIDEAKLRAGSAGTVHSRVSTRSVAGLLDSLPDHSQRKNARSS